MIRRRSDVDHSSLMALVPSGGDRDVEWAAIWALWPELAAMDVCPQDPVFHAEGDVGTHSRMVVEALVSDPLWQGLPADDRALLFWAAVLHDTGKPATTRHEGDGRITSRGHSRVGASIARSLLWEAGSPFWWREALCGLISSHQLPFWLIEREAPERLAIETSWRCRGDHLCLHARADIQGRICDDAQRVLDHIDLAEAVFDEAGCLSSPFPFSNDESRVAFFEREDRDPHYAAHEEFRCTVTVMSGLPGSGKDTWLHRNRPDLPVVSLDAIRAETGERASGNQGRVVQAARERAREYLRKGRDFAWNATNVSRQTRGPLTALLRSYNARIEVIYIERGPEQLFAQNNARDDAVPEAAIRGMLAKLDPPTCLEAHRVAVVTG